MEKLVILIFLASLMVNKGFRDAGPPLSSGNFFFSVVNVRQMVLRALLLKYIFLNKHCN